MAGQVDIIISKQAIAEIDSATAKLETLRLKLLDVNKAGSQTKGVSNNDKIVEEIQKTNALIAAQKNLVSNKKKATASIKGTAQALVREISQLKKEQKTLSTSNRSWLEYEMRIMKVQGNLRQLMATQNKVSIATRKSSKASGGFMKSLGGIGKLLTGGGILFGLIKLKDLAVALFKNIFDLAKQFDSLRFALERTSSSLSEAKMNSAFMLKLSSDLGLSLVATTTRFIKFAAAARNSGLAMKDVQKIFGTMAKAGAVLGLRTDELSGVFLALEQMLSKGKVTTEELRRQLGERLPGAFGIMAASLGVTLPELDKLLKAGKLLSAEVLPGFARAVELAFGLDTVDKVETLVASQNRLTTSWQNFVKNLTGEGSVIKGFFKGIYGAAEAFVKGIDALFNSVEVGNAEAMSKGFDDQTKLIKEAALKELNDTKKDGEKLKDLQLKVQKALIEARGKLEDDAAHTRVQETSKALLDFADQTDKIEERIAKEKYNATYTAFALQEQLVKEHQEKIAKLDVKINDPSQSAGRSGFNLERRREVVKLTEATKVLNEVEGKMNATRLLAESSKSPDVEVIDSRKGLNDIADFERKKQAEILATYIKFNELKIQNSEAGDENILGLMKVTSQKQTLIAKILEEDKIDILTKGIRRQQEAIQKGIDNGVINKTEGNKNIAELEKQLSDKTIIETEKTRQKIEDINEGYAKRSSDFVKKDFAFQINEEKAKLGKSKTNLRENYENDIAVFGLTQGEKKKINKDYLSDKDKAEVESHNLTMDLMIAEVTALAALTTATDAQKQSLADTIAILEGQKKVPKVEGEEDDSSVVNKKKEEFRELLGYASQYADALTGIATGIIDGKIADIDREIEATKAKYDEMYLLAEGDAKQTRLLQIQEARDLDKLEKKKKKLQRQKAIFEKANAVISIVLNTAIAASRVAADTGLLGIPLLPIIYGLGALQIAAVLAQPLPKFAQGGVMSHDGLAVVGDGGKQEVIRTPDGKVSLTPSTDTVVNLEKGTEIFSSVDKFNQQNPNEMSGLLHSASLLASISLNQKNINGMMSGQKELDERLLDAMLLNTKAVKNSKSNTFVKTQKIDIAHELWKSNLLN